MAILNTLDRPWSRRLVTLEAAERLGRQGLLTIVGLLQRSESQHWPIAGVFPGEDGGLRIEWRAGREQTLVEVEEDGTIYVAYFNFATGVEADLDNAEHSKAVNFLDEHLNA